ncbi:hypothetical protein SAMN06265379_101848 [Saccharicrinis carchari]|uniref:Uncharacterized protein n=1 Tax=Saccharicrinis carchari TaxID=1168039 RepID=A0A521BBG4_SACCC|nr:hypothetical protein [Saccharicrinis carchari]SMO44426.1 hypothetical protein SAMN06265379_101848 [Saccharicrinis carchari]
MIIREINKRFIAILTLAMFLLSTNGMVLFYHYCQHGSTVEYVMFMDSTYDQCRENATDHCHIHHPEKECCEQHNDKLNENFNEEHFCCSDHKTYTKTLKLKNEYNSSDRQAMPKPICLELFLSNISPGLSISNHTIFTTEGWRELPLEKPLFQYSGTQLVTLYRTLKIAC